MLCFFCNQSCFIYCHISTFFNFFLDSYKTLFDFFELISCFFNTIRCFFYCVLYFVYYFNTVRFRSSCLRRIRRSRYFVILFLLFVFMIVLILIVVNVLDIFNFVNCDVETLLGRWFFKYACRLDKNIISIIEVVCVVVIFRWILLSTVYINKNYSFISISLSYFFEFFLLIVSFVRIILTYIILLLRLY